MPEKLTITREINAACHAAAMGRGRCVYAEVEGETVRIVAARRREGKLEVKVLTSAPRSWYPAAYAYTA